MKKVAGMFFVIMLLTNFAESADKDRQIEYIQLRAERSRIQEMLAQQPPPRGATFMLQRLNYIEKKIRDMEGDMPASPEPPLSEVDQADLPVSRPPLPSPDNKRYRFDFSISPSFSNNYFQAVAGTPRQDTFITNVSASFQLDLLQNKSNRLIAGIDVRRNLVRDIENADWSMYGARLIYARQAHQLAFQGFYTPKRLTFITGDGESGLARTSGFGADYTGRFTPRTRVRLFYRLNDVRYPEFNERNLKAHFAAVDMQYRFHNLFVPGVGFEWSDAVSKSDGYDYRELTPVLLLGMRFGRKATLNLRYRYRRREYVIDDIDSANYGRRDWRHDAYLNANIGLGKNMNLVMFGNYVQKFSTRENRSFAAFNTGIMLRFRFPGQ